jgi:hypothetical protein
MNLLQRTLPALAATAAVAAAPATVHAADLNRTRLCPARPGIAKIVEHYGGASSGGPATCADMDYVAQTAAEHARGCTRRIDGEITTRFGDLNEDYPVYWKLRLSPGRSAGDGFLSGVATSDGPYFRLTFELTSSC